MIHELVAILLRGVTRMKNSGSQKIPRFQSYRILPLIISGVVVYGLLLCMYFDWKEIVVRHLIWVDFVLGSQFMVFSYSLLDFERELLKNL